jgi:hypothetical protein
MIRSVAVRQTLALLLPLALSTAALGGDKPKEKVVLKGINGKGKVRVPIYKLTMAQGVPYLIEAEGTGFEPRVTIVGTFFSSMSDSGNRSRCKGIFTPRETKDYLVAIMPDPYGPLSADGPMDYTLKVRPVILATKPLLQVDGKFTEQDMKLKYQDRNTYYKTYPIKLKAGRTYSIELVHPEGSQIDPYLFLKDGDQVVASDDDSGGNLNARIIYTPTKDGEFTIIATTLRPGTTGPSVLTVRGSAEGKAK